MTRKDFELVAGVLRGAKGYMPELNWQRLVLVTSNELQDRNPRFDRMKFVMACGWEA